MMSPRRSMWRRFKRHKLAVIALVIVILFYVLAMSAEFFATSNPYEGRSTRSLVPPQPIYLFDDGAFYPHVCLVQGYRDSYTLRKLYRVDCANKVEIVLFASGFEYKLLGFLPTDKHLLGVSNVADYKAEECIFILGTDAQGRDLYSRIIYGTRTSMTIGLLGVLINLVLGVTIGGISGFFGGVIDNIVQRSIEIIRSVPTIPLWMGLVAALPYDWSIIKQYFVITIIISLFAWTDLARIIRGRVLVIREEDFIMAAIAVGAKWPTIIFRHILPSLYSQIIATATLAIPFMIISETSLSFLGLGLRPPAISWGVLLQAAQNIQSIALTPWLLIPAIPVILVILSLNFLGDGLRDALDPCH